MLKIRKILLSIERIHHEGGPARAIPVTMGSVAALVRNPYAGRYVEDLSEMAAAARELARSLVPELLAALGGKDRIEAYGKGAIVGTEGSWSTVPSGTRPAAGPCARRYPARSRSFPQ